MTGKEICLIRVMKILKIVNALGLSAVSMLVTLIVKLHYAREGVQCAYIV